LRQIRVKWFVDGIELIGSSDQLDRCDLGLRLEIASAGAALESSAARQLFKHS
jgi:hypothetical protein